MESDSSPASANKPKRRFEPAGFATKSIIIGIIWTILLGTSLAVSIKYGIDLSQLVSTRPNSSVHHGPIRIGVYNWAGFYPLIVANENGLFKKYGIQVELVHAKSIGELNDSIRVGRTQVSVGVLADFVVLRRLGAPIRLMTVVDYSIADVILASPKIKNAKDLAGKRIGLSELNSFAQYFVVRGLELAGVNPRSVNFYTVPAEKVPSAILSGEIDAGHTWNPHLDEGLSRGLKAVISTADYPRLVIDGIVYRSEVLNDRHVPLAVTRAFFEALTIKKNNPVAYATAAAKYFGMSATQAQKFIDDDARSTDLDENIRLFSSGGVLQQEASAIGAFFAERGVGGEEIDIQKLIDDSVIRQLEDERAVGDPPIDSSFSKRSKSTSLAPRFGPTTT